MPHRLFLLTVFCGVFASFSAAMAEDQTPVDHLSARTKAILEKLDENQARQFQSIRASHGVLRSVADVKKLLGQAVTSCAKKNPDLADPARAHFAAWTGTVDPIARKGQNRLEKMILLQSYAKPSEVRSYLRAFDKAVDWRRNQTPLVPVSDHASCEKMIASMNDTQEELSKVLTETLMLDEPLIIKSKDPEKAASSSLTQPETSERP